MIDLLCPLERGGKAVLVKCGTEVLISVRRAVRGGDLEALRDHLSEQVARKADRKRRARAAGPPGPWFGLGAFGMIGWSIALPSVLGALLGLWLDHAHPGRFSWTLSLLLAGLAPGFLAAWQWVDRMGPPHE